MQVNTSCGSCVFASFPENTQVGCDIGMLEKFQKAGTEIKEEKDEDKESLVICGRVCPACRPKEWAEEHKGEDLASLVRRERSLRLHVVVPVCNSTYDDISLTLNSLTGQTHKPIKVTVALNQDGMVSSQVISHLRGRPFEWSVFTCVERENGRRVQEGRLLDMVASDIKTPFYMVMKPGSALAPDAIARIDAHLNDELGRFSLLEDRDFYVVPTSLHRHLEGNVEVLAGEEKNGPEEELKSLPEKIRFAARVENQQHMIVPFSSLGEKK